MSQNTILITSDELAPTFKVTGSAIRYRAKHKPETLPPFIRFGRNYKWRMSDVQAWLDAQAEKSKAVQS